MYIRSSTRIPQDLISPIHRSPGVVCTTLEREYRAYTNPRAYRRMSESSLTTFVHTHKRGKHPKSSFYLVPKYRNIPETTSGDLPKGSALFAPDKRNDPRKSQMKGNDPLSAKSNYSPRAFWSDGLLVKIGIQGGLSSQTVDEFFVSPITGVCNGERESRYSILQRITTKAKKSNNNQ